MSIAHAGLDIIKSKDPVYKNEMKNLDLNGMKSKNNGSINGSTPTVDDPLLVLKKLFRHKDHKTRILDKNQIANKYRHKYLEDMKKEEKRNQTLLI